MLGLGSSLDAQKQLLPVLRFGRLVLPSGRPYGHIIRDSEGFVWYAEGDGLERYDGYSTRHYTHVENDPYSLAGGTVSSLLLDSRHRIWVGTSSSCLSLYDRSGDRFLNFPVRCADSSSIRGSEIRAILECRSGGPWLATASGLWRAFTVVDKGSRDADSLSRIIRFEGFPSGVPINGMCERDDGEVVVATDSGLLVFDPGKRTFSRPHFADAVGRRLSSLTISCVVQDSAGDLWLGTTTEGLFHVEWGTQRAQNFRHREGDSLSIGDDNIRDLALDPEGHLWVANLAPIERFSPATGRCIPFLTWGARPSGHYSARLAVDQTGSLWITTLGVAYWLSPRSHLFKWYTLRDDYGFQENFLTIDPAGGQKCWLTSVQDFLYLIDLPSQRILKSIDVYKHAFTDGPFFWNRNWTLVDRHGFKWDAAQSLGLYKVNPANGRVSIYRPTSNKVTMRVKAVAHGRGDSLWIAAGGDGLMVFDPRTERFSTILAGSVPVVNVMQDREGLVWIATGSEGLLLYDPLTSTTSRLVHNASESGSLSEGRTESVFQDSSGRIWVGAGNTVNLWDFKTRSFHKYRNSSLPDSRHCLPMGIDRRGHLWIKYEGSILSILDPTTGEFTNLDSTYGFQDGLPCDMETLPDGEVVLAGLGITAFFPESLNTRRRPPSLVLTRMAINDRDAFVPALVSGAGSMQLAHTENMLEFEFVAPDIEAPHLVHYQYQLEGLEEEWVHPKDRRYVRYTGLSPGNYVFRVRASTRDGEWPDQEVALAFSIAPPWWRTWWAYTFYSLFIAWVLYSLRRYEHNRLRLKHSLEIKEVEARKLKEVDELKSRFFANISHEFRTPLTLILGPARQILDGSTDEETKAKADLIHRSGRQLNRLVDELLDLARVEAGQMKLNARPVNVVSVVHDLALTFQPLAERRKIAFSCSSDEREIVTFLDRDKVDRILANVLSNAFKFTPEGGQVDVRVSPSSPHLLSEHGEGATGQGGGWVSISVCDTGIGIPADQLGKIFDRFYQVDGSHTREQEGTGIGLALTRELVELHSGKIEVESEEGKGSTFRVIFPLGKEHLKPEEISEDEDQAEETETPPLVEQDTLQVGEYRAQGDAPDKSGLPLLLIVEDNADVREYIKSILSGTCRFLEARDGEEGLVRSSDSSPDLIITDIMMPKMDGIELCGKLKTDPRTSHIPVIMLTAKATSKDKIAGLDIGADDYITKPFEALELAARIRNLIEQRRRLHDHFRAYGLVDMAEQNVTPVDQKFLKKALEVVNEHIPDTSFSVEVFAGQMAVSRSLLIRKVESLLGEPPSELIKRTRLNRAAVLLERKAGNVSEIGLEVGFSNPSYFAECFRKQFGCTPTHYCRNLPHSPSGRERQTSP